MPVIPIESLDDPRVDAYRNMKDKELARDGQRFIAEGEQVVRRLLASSLSIESVLAAQRKIDRIEPLTNRTTLYAASDAAIEKIIGFEFHSGVLAVGLRPAAISLDSVLPLDRPRMTLAACQQITNTENMGALVRTCAAFGVDAMLLGERCCDPFFRQSVRVSMGSVFRLPLVRSPDFLGDLRRLRQRWGMQIAATVLNPDAEPLTAATRPDRLALVFGGEADGLDAATIAACDRRLTLPMRLGTDSLNVATAAAVFLYHFSHIAT